MTERKAKVVLCGHYGSTNIGDEAIGLGIIETIKKYRYNADICVLSYNPGRSKKIYDKMIPEYSVKSAYLLPFGIKSFLRGVFKGELKRTLKVIRDCDHFVLGGGGLFSDEKPFAVFLWAFQAFVAHKYKKPVYMIAQSVGPLKTRTARRIVKNLFGKAKEIHLRDKASEKLLRKIGVKNNIIVSTDAAFGMKKYKKHSKEWTTKKLNKKIEQEAGSEHFVLSAREWDTDIEKLNKILVQSSGAICEKHRLKAIFIPFQVIKENDRSILDKKFVRSGVRECFVLLNCTDDVAKVLSVISGAKFMIGVRLHSLIFSIITATPFIGISYSSKINDFARSSGLDKYILDKDIPSGEFLEKLEKKLEEVATNYDDIKLELEKISEDLRKTWDANMREFIEKTF